MIRYCQFIKDMVSNQKIHDAMLDDKMWFTMIDEDEQLSSLKGPRALEAPDRDHAGDALVRQIV